MMRNPTTMTVNPEGAHISQSYFGDALQMCVARTEWLDVICH